MARALQPGPFVFLMPSWLAGRFQGSAKKLAHLWAALGFGHAVEVRHWPGQVDDA